MFNSEDDTQESGKSLLRGSVTELPDTGSHHLPAVQQGLTIDLVEEELHASTRQVLTGEVILRRQVVNEIRTIQIPVRREELVVERHSISRRPVDGTEASPRDPLVEQLVERLRHMADGEILRIPIIEDDVVVTKRPVVVEEITVGKRIIADVHEVSETIRREELRTDF